MVIAYLVLVELGKTFFYHHMPEEPVAARIPTASERVIAPPAGASGGSCQRTDGAEAPAMAAPTLRTLSLAR